MSPDCQSFVTTLASLSLLLLATLELVLPDSSPAAERYWDYVVIGAGPAGLQMGYYLQKAGRQYVIVERNNISGGLRRQSSSSVFRWSGREHAIYLPQNLLGYNESVPESVPACVSHGSSSTVIKLKKDNMIRTQKGV